MFVMKRLLLILMLAFSAFTYSAQAQGGVAWGADRDTLKYIIASPFDNWFLNFSGGIQSFIGNPPDAEAYWNKADYGVRVDIGKWIIPDLAVLVRLGFATAHSQSRFGGNNPWSDISNPINYSGAEYGPYYPIKANLLSAIGLVAVDWTNFFNGYEAGRRNRFHFYTQAGLGGVVLIGKIINPNYVNKVNSNPNEENVALGDIGRNFELGFMGGITAEYYCSDKWSLFSSLDLLFARGSLDDYNYNLDADRRRIDLIPSFYIGVKFDILQHINKYHPDTKTASRDTVYHEFQTMGSLNTLKILNGNIDRLTAERDKLLDDIDDLSHNDSLTIDSLNRELGRLQDSKKLYEPESKYIPESLVDELMDINKALELPCTVVYFELDKYYLDYNARKDLQEFAKKAILLPDTIEFYMIGAADSLTGSIVHNQWLSERRCEAAYYMLTEHYSLSGNQLIKIYAGGINDYARQEDNRMVLVIQRTPVTEEIVNRWLRMSRERLEQDSKRNKRK